VRLPGSSSTPRPGLRSAHGRRVACSPPRLRTRRCGPRATRTGAPGHQHHVGERELSASVGPTLPTGGVHCRPAGAGGGSASRRHRGSPTCTSSRPDHARPPPRRRRGWGRPLLLALRALTRHRSPWPPTAVRGLCHGHRSTRRRPDHPPPLSSRALRARSLPAARPSPVATPAFSTWLVGRAVIVVSGRVLPTCCAPVYAAAPAAGLPHGQGQAGRGQHQNAQVCRSRRGGDQQQRDGQGARQGTSDSQSRAGAPTPGHSGQGWFCRVPRRGLSGQGPGGNRRALPLRYVART